MLCRNRLLRHALPPGPKHRAENGPVASKPGLVFYDMKEKCATDMWDGRRPARADRSLGGHASVPTIGRYVTSLWPGTVAPNKVAKGVYVDRPTCDPRECVQRHVAQHRAILVELEQPMFQHFDVDTQVAGRRRAWLAVASINAERSPSRTPCGNRTVTLYRWVAAFPVPAQAPQGCLAMPPP